MNGQKLKQLFQEKGLQLPADFHFGEKVARPDQQGCYCGSDGWYLYEVDDHGMCTLCGPFDEQSIVYACALKLHVSASMAEWKFSDRAMHTYLHGHIHTT